MGKACQFVFKMERLQHFELMGLGTSLATSHSKEGISEKWDKPRTDV